MSSTKCRECGLTNFSTAEVCKRCGAKLHGESGETDEFADTTHGKVRHSKIIKRLMLTPAIIFFILLAFYLSLLLTSDSINAEQKQTVERAISMLEQKGFEREVFILRRLVSFRSTDNWWNSALGHADAYAATNFPFEVVTLYEDFFKIPVNDTERAAVLLHEAHHLRGDGELEAFSGVWKEKRRLGWTEDKYGSTNVWRNVRESTMKYAPYFFKCGDGQSDCVP